MTTPLSVRSARFSCLPCLQSQIEGENAESRGRTRPRLGVLPLAMGVALAALFAMPGRAHAQQDPAQYWPPDDNSGESSPAYPQQYPPAAPQYPQQQQYGYAGQSQYPAQGYGSQGYGSAPQFAPQQGYGQQLGQAQPLSPDQLTQLVAPIALYPDALVAQILTGSTYPAQVSAADQWRRSMGNAPSEQIVEGANAQSSWDPSVKALTAFPQVLAMMDQNLQWTTALGNAYYNQPQDVLQTIQVMRQRAESAGNLESTPQEMVNDNQGYINIAPTNPQEVSLPSYNPWDVYGQPVTPYPGFSLLGAIGSFIGSALVNYGPGIGMSAFMSTPWGWLGWGLDWLAHAILFNHDDYWTHSTSVRDWGFAYGGPRYRGWHDGDRGRGWDRGGWGRDGYNHAFIGHDGNGRAIGGPVRPVGGPVRGYGDARTMQGFNRGFPSRNEGYNRFGNSGQQFAYNQAPHAYGGPQRPIGGPQAFGGRQQMPSRPNYGSGYSDPMRGGYSNRSGMAFANPGPGYSTRGGSSFGELGARGNGYSGYSGYSGHSSNNWVSGSQHSGGFRMFGGGHSSNEYKAPKSYSFGGGHSGGWGGGSFKAPKESHFGGGGHSFGRGGGHFGGGHSGGGGHSSGGGHGHHR